MIRPRLLDLFCGAGGAAAGYVQAGFDVVGVDSAPQPHYPYEFIQADALAYLNAADLTRFDVIHASPVCKGYSAANNIRQKTYPLLIAQTRQRLQEIGKPYIIENVVMTGKWRGHMPSAVVLCGTMFGLKVYRHRYFESSHLLFTPQACTHPHALLDGYVCIYGDVIRGRQVGRTGNHYTRYSNAVGRAAMGIDWHVTQKELSQAIPPAYTDYLGAQLLYALRATESGGAA